MPTCLDVKSWRKSSKAETLEFLQNRARRKQRTGGILAISKRLRPVDVYAYLRARFGIPNGLQNFLRRDDSDNIVHWDFQLKAGLEDVYISGHLREVHIMVSEDLTDEQWKSLINEIKSDYKRFAKEKSEIQKSFEKYIIFQNKYVALANLCADLHEQILEAPTSIEVTYPSGEHSLEDFQEQMNRRSKRSEALFGDCLKLRLLMPIMAEAYINMLILTFCKAEIRDDRTLYENFLRTGFPDRLHLLSMNCDGFSKATDNHIPGYADFMRVMNKRNFALHGNVAPQKEPIETVYFEGRRPLYVNPGNNIELLFEYMEAHADASGLLNEYEQLHNFLHELSTCLTDDKRAFFEQVASDAYPGFRTDVRRPTRLFPDHYVWNGLPGIRSDNQLDVHW